MCAYDLFSDQYKNAYEKAFPIISTKRKNNSSFNQPWMTKGLLKSTKKGFPLSKIRKKSYIGQ